MNIQPIHSGMGGLEAVNPIDPGMGSQGPSSFAGLLERSIGEVNELLGAADKKSSDLAIGKSENIHDAMIALEKADAALKLLVQMRSKAIEAYNDIMHMQV